MSEWTAKRFWTAASVAQAETGFAITLDGRPVRTPAKTKLVVPSKALAKALAAEWDAQSERIDPETMPLTKLANSAQDKVAIQHREVAAMLADYGGSDLLCYRAERPDALVERQKQQWDPLLAWAADELGIRLVATAGVMHFAQPDESLARISDFTHALDAFSLTAFHEFVSLSGSWVIGYAALTGARPLEELWTAAHVDEDWQIEQWGPDEEAAELRESRQAGFATAGRFLVLSQAD